MGNWVEPRVKNTLVPYIGMGVFFYITKIKGEFLSMNEQLIKLTFPDGQVKEYNKGCTISDVAESISSILGKNAVAGKVDEQLVDVNDQLEKDAKLTILTIDSDEGLSILRHSSAHILAQAIKRIYGNVQLGIGPVIENGFYYDLKLGHSLTTDDLRLKKKWKTS